MTAISCVADQTTDSPFVYVNLGWMREQSTELKGSHLAICKVVFSKLGPEDSIVMIILTRTFLKSLRSCG